MHATRNTLTVIALPLLVFTAIYSMRMALRPDPSGRLIVAEPYVYVGKVPRGGTGLGEFVVCNDTGLPVHLNDAKPTYPCTVIGFKPRTLEQGEVFRFGGEYKVGSARGRSYASIMLNYSLPRGVSSRTSTIELRLVADIEPDYLVEPQRLEFGPRSRSSQTLTITPNRLANLEISTVELSRAAFSARLRDATTGSKTRRIEVTYDPSANGQPMQGDPPCLMIKTNSAHEPTHRFALAIATPKTTVPTTATGGLQR